MGNERSIKGQISIVAFFKDIVRDSNRPVNIAEVPKIVVDRGITMIVDKERAPIRDVEMRLANDTEIHMRGVLVIPDIFMANQGRKISSPCIPKGKFKTKLAFGGDQKMVAKASTMKRDAGFSGVFFDFDSDFFW